MEGAVKDVKDTKDAKVVADTGEDKIAEVSPSTLESQISTTGEPMAALKEMLNSNFDAVPKPASLTLCKYLFNT